MGMRLDIYDAVTRALKNSVDLANVPISDPRDFTLEPTAPLIEEGMVFTVEHDGCRHPVYRVVGVKRPD